MDESLRLNVQVHLRVDVPPHAIHDPVNIICNKLNERPDAQEEHPERNVTCHEGRFSSRELNQCIKKFPCDVGNKAIGNSGHDTQGNENPKLFLEWFYVSCDRTQPL